MAAPHTVFFNIHPNVVNLLSIAKPQIISTYILHNNVPYLIHNEAVYPSLTNRRTVNMLILDDLLKDS